MTGEASTDRTDETFDPSKIRGRAVYQTLAAPFTLALADIHLTPYREPLHLQGHTTHEKYSGAGDRPLEIIPFEKSGLLENIGSLIMEFQGVTGGYKACVSSEQMKAPASQFFAGTLESVSKPAQAFAHAAYAADTGRVIESAFDKDAYQTSGGPVIRGNQTKKNFILFLQPLKPAQP